MDFIASIDLYMSNIWEHFQCLVTLACEMYKNTTCNSNVIYFVNH